MEKLMLDTSVLVECIILRSPYRLKVTSLFDRALASKLELYVSVVTLSETLYIASRIYQVAGMDDPNSEATDFIEWVKSRARIVGVDEDVALRAGELKKMLHIALPDCYVIACAKAVNATPVFRGIEEEMKPVIENVRRLGVKFLNEID